MKSHEENREGRRTCVWVCIVSKEVETDLQVFSTTQLLMSCFCIPKQILKSRMAAFLGSGSALLSTASLLAYRWVAPQENKFPKEKYAIFEHNKSWCVTILKKKKQKQTLSGLKSQLYLGKLFSLRKWVYTAKEKNIYRQRYSLEAPSLSLVLFS